MKKLRIKPGSDQYEQHNKYFTREMLTHATLSHPFIVKYHDHFQDSEGQNYIILSLVKGRLRH